MKSNKETLEDTIAQKIRFQMDIVVTDFENNVETSMKVFYKVLENLLFEAEKEQQERMYSEEDMKQAFRSGRMVENYKAEWEETYSDEMTSCKYADFKEWFEQFKKK